MFTYNVRVNYNATVYRYIPNYLENNESDDEQSDNEQSDDSDIESDEQEDTYDNHVHESIHEIGDQLLDEILETTQKADEMEYNDDCHIKRRYKIETIIVNDRLLYQNHVERNPVNSYFVRVTYDVCDCTHYGEDCNDTLDFDYKNYFVRKDNEVFRYCHRINTPLSQLLELYNKEGETIGCGGSSRWSDNGGNCNSQRRYTIEKIEVNNDGNFNTIFKTQIHHDEDEVFLENY